MNRSCTLMILFRIRDCRKTQTSRTSRFWGGGGGGERQGQQEAGHRKEVWEPSRALQYLPVLVLDLLTRGDTVGDVQVDELRRQVHSRGQPEGQTRLVTGSAHAQRPHPLVQAPPLPQAPPPRSPLTC